MPPPLGIFLLSSANDDELRELAYFLSLSRTRARADTHTQSIHACITSGSKKTEIASLSLHDEDGINGPEV